MKRANEWTRDQLTKWGLQNGHLEAWGPFGRSWVLKDKIVLTNTLREVKAHFDALGKRLTEKELLDLADAPEPGAQNGFSRFMNSQQFGFFIKNQVFGAKKLQFFTDEGAALLIDPSQGDLKITGAQASCLQEQAGKPALRPIGLAS